MNFDKPKIEQPKKYDSAMEFVTDKFGNYQGLEKVVRERMEAAEKENIKLGSEDFTNFVLGYCAGDMTKSVFEVMHQNIKNIVAQMIELESHGILEAPRKEISKKIATPRMIREAGRMERRLGIKEDEE